MQCGQKKGEILGSPGYSLNADRRWCPKLNVGNQDAQNGMVAEDSVAAELAGLDKEES